MPSVKDSCCYIEQSSQNGWTIYTTDEEGYTHRRVANQFGVSESAVNGIISGHTWWYLTGLPKRRVKK